MGEAIKAALTDWLMDNTCVGSTICKQHMRQVISDTLGSEACSGTIFLNFDGSLLAEDDANVYLACERFLTVGAVTVHPGMSAGVAVPSGRTPGPDIPGIYCYTPDLCCSASPCDITEDAFICQIRTLLPGGRGVPDLAADLDPNVTVVSGATTVGCWKVGCEQMVYGGACEDVVQCSDSDGAPQLGVVDSFSATAYTYVTALCDMLRELDPCTAVVTIGDWAARFGVPKSARRVRTGHRRPRGRSCAPSPACAPARSSTR